ncbi:sigma factor [Planotetraspora mira]|uniref:RNA polymerase sigma-70 region 2 domain-containing protein n=1 Tax=Planotetraspora mira TaxID=58121 RepID=A0A8J3TJV4_9ACTN|nr:sigma factor [Planotetraspora mira]GII28388.1 hypothetical protein Pmi06nite_18300 [Planotetraspora mira]
MNTSHDVAAAPPSDVAVIESSWHEPERFAEIFHRYFTEIHRYIARRLGADVADDLATETFLAAFRKRSRFDVSRGAVRPWLYDSGRVRRTRPSDHAQAGSDRLVAELVLADQTVATASTPTIAERLPLPRKAERPCPRAGLSHIGS